MKSKTYFGALKLCASKKAFSIILKWNSLGLYANPNVAPQNIYIDSVFKKGVSLKDAIINFLKSHSPLPNVEVQKSNVFQLNIYACKFAKGKKGQESLRHI